MGSEQRQGEQSNIRVFDTTLYDAKHDFDELERLQNDSFRHESIISSDTQYRKYEDTYQIKRPSRISKGKSAKLGLFTGLAVSVAAIGLTVADKVGDFLDSSVHIDVPDGLGAKPPEITAEIMPELFEVEGFFEMNTMSRIGVAVNVTGKKDGALWGAFGITDANYNKRLFGDYLTGSDEAKLNDSLVITKEGDKVTSVSVTLDALDIFQPRVDFMDPRNYVNIDASDSIEEQNQKVAEFMESGENYDARGGFDCTACNTDAIEMVNMAQFLTQYGITIDGRQPEIMADMTQRYANNITKRMMNYFDIPIDKIDITIQYGPGMDPLNPPTPEQVTQIYKDRMNQAYEEAFSKVGIFLFKISPELRQHDDGSQFIYAETRTGADLYLELSDITYTPEVKDLIVSNIKTAEARFAEQQEAPVAVSPETTPQLGPYNAEPDDDYNPMFNLPTYPKSQP